MADKTGKTTMLNAIKSFLFRRTEGGATVGNILWFIVAAMVSGVALDGANAWRLQQQLQIAADAAALAAAANIEDQTEASRIALEVAGLNLAAAHGDAILDTDIVFGIWDETTGAFEAGETPSNAVRVTAQRNAERDNQIGTFLLKLAGIDRLNAAAQSMALAVTTASGCENATILTSASMSTGGGNTWNNDVCLHGETGVHTGGNDYYGEGVYVSAANESDVVINTVASGSRSAEEVAVGRSLQPVIVPQLDTMFNTLWTELSGRDGQTYTTGTLPSFMSGATIRELSATWVVFKPAGSLQPWEHSNPGVVEIAENTIYVAPGSVTFEGNVDADNIAIIANNMIQIGGGANLSFTNVYFFAGTQFNASGSVLWGDPATYCDSGSYNAYLFARTFMSLGGAAGVYGVVGAAPQFSPGGAMQSAGGVYFEASTNVALGGNYNVTGCGSSLSSEVTIQEPSLSGSAHTRLIY